jgi:hypothetical protein
LRLGKLYECGAKETREQLYQVLELCKTYSFRPILTSKLLEFDYRVADLTIAAKGIIHLSLGWDEYETGAVNRGSTNRWRLAQALKYKRYGCPVQVRIVADKLGMSSKNLSYLRNRYTSVFLYNNLKNFLA